MAIIKRYRNKKTFYQAELFIKGFRIATKTFSTKREAFVWHEKEKHKLTFNPERLNDRMTLSECVKKFWKDIQSRVSKSTLQTYEFALEEYFCSGPLSSLKMEEVKGIKVTEWISWLREHPTAKNKKRKSFVKELDLLKTILNWYKNFLNEDFNVPVTKKHKQMCFFKPISPRRPDYFMKAEEAKTWVEWLKQHRSNPVYWRLATFMLLTGARVGEACGLKWEVIDFDLGIAKVIRRVRWDYRSKKPFLEDVTKTALSARILTLPKKLQEVLQDMKKSAVNDLVFTDRHGGLLKYNAVQSAFNHGFMALKLPWRSTHICRHTYATLALMTTKNLPAVQASLGHAEQRMTQRYAKTVALLSSETGEKTADVIFKHSLV